MISQAREKQILELASRAEGATYEEVAAALGVSIQTARRYLGTIARTHGLALKIRQVAECAGTRWGEKHVWRVPEQVSGPPEPTTKARS